MTDGLSEAARINKEAMDDIEKKVVIRNLKAMIEDYQRRIHSFEMTINWLRARISELEDEEE